MRKSNGFRWKALSQRQKRSPELVGTAERIQRLQRHHRRWRYPIGQDLCHEFFFVQWAMTCYSGQQFAMCGKTIASFRRNVLGTLKQQLAARGYNAKEHRAENCMTVSKGGRTNEFYFFGGKDESSQDLIRASPLRARSSTRWP